MQIRKSHRILAAALALVMVVGMLPTMAFARSAGNDGSAEMNEAYAAKETLMPIGPSFNVDTLLEWTPESDPDAMYSRASIKLADREGGFVVNPLVNPEAKLMLCSLANSDHDHTSAQGTESFLSYAFNYWQYTNSFVYWSGSEEGLICCPTGEFTDAAHANGVPVVATLGFPWGSGSGYVEQVKNFVQKADDGSFPIADKLIEVMDYYGFDGYFFNQESYGCSAAEGQLIDEMMRYMHKKRPNMLISWYDSMLPTGGVSYQNAVNDSNKQFMTDSADGTRAIDEFFMNYNWYDSQVTTTISTMKSIGRSQFDAFAGINVQENCMNSSFQDNLLVDADGMTRLSLALYCPNSTLGLAKSGEDFHEVERTFYTNAKADPRDTSVNLSTNAWAGMSRFFADHTVILDAPFVTDFNSGHGRAYYVDGVKSRDAEWSYQSTQDVMPTWTWIIDSEGEKLEGGYDFTTAWNGGNSIKFSGSLSAGKANDIMLYSTIVEVTSGMKLGLTYKGDQGKMKLVAYYGNKNTASYEDCTQVAYDLTASIGDWTTTQVDLSANAGKTLYAIGLKIESDTDVSDYQVNLGRLTLIEKDRAALTGPSTVTLDEILYTDAYTAEARVYWTAVTGASSYEIYKVNADGSKTLIMETPSTAFYIPTLSRDSSETDVTIEVVPLNRNGERGTGTELTIAWEYGNDDTEKVETVEFDNVCLNATITDVSHENSGEPASKALDGTSANNSKWCSTNHSNGYLAIDLGREVTVKRWRVEHGEYGGEDKATNTDTFALQYLDTASNNWVEVKKIFGNEKAVTDVLLDEPVTAQQWRLYVYNAGHSPWQAIRIYEWQMFETDQFPKTDPVPMHFASAVNGEGATDTFTLSNVSNGQTVKVYTRSGDTYTLIGSAESNGSTVTITDLDFGTAEAGRVYYTTTATAADESYKFSTAFDAESAEKSEPAKEVSFEKFSRAGSVSSSFDGGVYTSLTVSGLGEGDVVYTYENGEKAAIYTKKSLPVASGETSVTLDGVLVAQAGGELTLRVKRAGKLLSDFYTVTTPAFDEPTATLRLFGRNSNGESLTGVRFLVLDASGETVAEINTTSDSGGTAEIPLGDYTIKTAAVPSGYSCNMEELPIHLRIEGWEYTSTVSIPNYSDPVLSGITIENADKATLIVGSSYKYTAKLTGEGDYDDSVIWTVQGATSEKTTVDAHGNLTIGDDENAAYITIVAKAAANESITDSRLAYVTTCAALPTGDILGYTGSKLDEADGPKAAFDGDMTTKWTEEGSKWVMVDLNGKQTLDSVKIYHAGTQEPGAANTASLAIYRLNPSHTWSTAEFWKNYGLSGTTSYINGYLDVTYGYTVPMASVSGNTSSVTTFTFDEPTTTDVLLVRVMDDNVNIYEVEAIGTDNLRVDAAELALRIAELKDTEITKDSGGLLKELRDAYDALPETHKDYVDTLDILAAAEATYANFIRQDYKDALTEYHKTVKANGMYTENGKAKLDAALEEGLKLIDNAQSGQALEKALADGKTLIDNVPDMEREMKEALEAAEKAALAAAKYYAHMELTRMDLADLNADQKEMAQQIIADGRKAIDEAASIDEVNAIMDQIRADIADLDGILCAAEDFTDVNRNAWYHTGVDYVYNAGYMVGTSDTTFSPYDSLTRAQLVTILYRMAGEPETTESMDFSDVAEGKYYENAVKWAAQEGIAYGYGDGTFRPNAEVTREELVVFLYRYAQAEAVEEDNLAKFADAENVSAFARTAMNWAVANGILSGKIADGATVLAPKDITNRAEFAAIALRYADMEA